MLKKIIPHDLHSFYLMVLKSLSFYGFGYFISFIASIFVTRTLGPEGRGLVTYIISLIGIGSGLAQLGMYTLNKKLAAENKELAGGLFISSIIISCLSSIAIIPLIFWLAKTPEILQHNKALLVYSMILIPVNAISLNVGEILIGLHKSKQYHNLFVTEKSVYAILLLIAIFLHSIDPFIIIIIFSLSLIIKIILCYVYLYEFISFNSFVSILSAKIEKKFILINYVCSLCFIFAYAILPTILSRFSTLSEVGYYAGSRVITDIIIISSTLYASYAIKKLVSDKDLEHYKKTKVHLIATPLIFFSLIAIFLYFISEWIIPLIFGHSFAAAVPCFRHLLPGIVFYTGFNIINSIFLVENKNKSLLFIALIYAGSSATVIFLISKNITAVTAADSFTINSFIIFLLALFLNNWNSKNKLYRRSPKNDATVTYQQQ